MQFIVNLFGTVIANKDVGKAANTGLRILDDKLRVLENHVDFLLQSHFSQQTVTLKTCDEYTSENGGEGEDREGGGDSAPSSIHGEEEDQVDAREVHADVPAGDSQGHPIASEAGAGSGETPAAQARADAEDSH